MSRKVLEVIHSYLDYPGVAIQDPSLAGTIINCGQSGLKMLMHSCDWLVIHTIPDRPPILWVHTQHTLEKNFEITKELLTDA